MMNSFFSKREFLSLMLRDRLPVAVLNFVIDKRRHGKIDFFCTPLGTALRISVGEKENLREIKMYDRSGGNFELQNVFCGDNLTKVDSGTYIGVSGKLQIEDVINRDFLIKTENKIIIARAKMIPSSHRVVDKNSRLVYN